MSLALKTMKAQTRIVAAVDWRDLNVLNNRPAYAICLIACLALCYAEAKDWSSRFFIWMPISSVLLFAFLPNEQLWAIATTAGSYPDRAKYFSGLTIYAVLLYFPVFLGIDWLFEKRTKQ
jgi:hypothetical protein